MSNMNFTNTVEAILKIRNWRENTKLKLIEQFDQQKSSFVDKIFFNDDITYIEMNYSQKKIWGIFAFALKFSDLNNTQFYNSRNLNVIDFIYKILNNDSFKDYTDITTPKEIFEEEQELPLDCKLLLILSFLLESKDTIHKFNFDIKFLTSYVSYFMLEILKFHDIKVFKHNVNLSAFQYLDSSDLFRILNNTNIESVKILIENIDPNIDEDRLIKYFANIQPALNNSSINNFELHFSPNIKLTEKILNIINIYQPSISNQVINGKNANVCMDNNILEDLADKILPLFNMSPIDGYESIGDYLESDAEFFDEQKIDNLNDIKIDKYWQNKCAPRKSPDSFSSILKTHKQNGIEID